MSKLFVAVAVAFGLFACYHYWPRATVRAGHKVVDTTVKAVRAGYNAATTDDGGDKSDDDEDMKRYSTPDMKMKKK
jgi:hypothetical protein